MPSELLQQRHPSVDAHWYEDVAEGMHMAVLGGTCRRAAIPGIEVCGKTGTAQNPHGKDHSAFMGFAPYKEPRIAVAAYIENGGWGATFGVPIGSLVMEKYLNGNIAPERKGMEAQMMNMSLYYDPPKKKENKTKQKADSAKNKSKGSSDKNTTKADTVRRSRPRASLSTQKFASGLAETLARTLDHNEQPTKTDNDK